MGTFLTSFDIGTGFGLTRALDDGIVVVRSGTGACAKEQYMFAFARSVVLKEKLGNEGLVELDSALDLVGPTVEEPGVRRNG